MFEKIADEGALNGLKTKTFLNRALSVGLQWGNAQLDVEGSKGLERAWDIIRRARSEEPRGKSLNIVSARVVDDSHNNMLRTWRSALVFMIGPKSI